MDQFTKEILFMDQGLVRENGFHLLLNNNLMNIKDSTIMIKKMDLEFINGLMDHSIKVSSKMILSKVKVQ